MYSSIISKRNLFSAWREFQNGKLKKKDVLEFKVHAEEMLLALHCELVNKTYRHSPYCDIKKFFDSVDHEILMSLLAKNTDTETLLLLQNIISSFHKGIPLGNLTSQLFSNVYLDKFDQYIKRELRIKYYIRYADDFVVFSNSETELQEILLSIRKWLLENLKLELHRDKVFIQKLHQGVDFLGWVHFLYYRVLRTKTKNRMMRKLKEVNYKNDTAQSYLGMIKHGNTHQIRKKIEYAVSIQNGG